VTQGFRKTRDRAHLERAAAAFGRKLSAAELEALSSYLELVTTWNAKLDLTAARETQQLVEVMICDAFVLAREDVIAVDSRCVDVGSGAGAPAVPLALLRSDLKLTLVEPLRKRVAFLRTVVGSLGLVARVSVIEGKLDPEAPSLPDAPYDVALSRATFAPELWVTTGLALAPRNLVMLAAQQPPAAAGAELERAVDYALPITSAQRKLAIYRGGHVNSEAAEAADRREPVGQE
jgi:16S rRNA (guanine527-N7)-methyltransferase